MGVNPLNVTRLGEGYALFTNSLNHPTNSCNPFLAGETTMMGKEHFIETFGVPFFTVSMGGSGGAYTSLQVADAFPGLFDGVVITSTFPDALSIATAGLDAHLLTHYFAGPAGAALTDAQKVAVSGYSSMKALVDAANQAQRTDPVPDRPDVPGYKSAVWHEAVPVALRYHPTTNPKGARPTIFDAARNIYGVDAKTGFARRTFDNVGVQYGLKALNDGVIAPQQFLDLNERLGGVDQDANYVPARATGDIGALRRAYQAGVTLGGGGGLASIPVFDAGPYNDAGGYHYQWFHFAVRERMKKQNGRADNHLMWRGVVPAERSWARSRTVGHGGEGRSLERGRLRQGRTQQDRRTLSTAVGWRRQHPRRRRFSPSRRRSAIGPTPSATRAIRRTRSSARSRAVLSTATC